MKSTLSFFLTAILIGTLVVLVLQQLKGMRDASIETLAAFAGVGGAAVVLYLVNRAKRREQTKSAAVTPPDKQA
jgi:uncharacterized membrane protein YeaQ/YmgE (transglycosylase-associated protein family)